MNNFQLFSNSASFGVTLTRPKALFTINTLIFEKNGPLSSHENAWSQCKIENDNEDKQLFH